MPKASCSYDYRKVFVSSLGCAAKLERPQDEAPVAECFEIEGNLQASLIQHEQISSETGVIQGSFSTCMEKTMMTVSPRRLTSVELDSARSEAEVEATGYSPPTPNPKMACMCTDMKHFSNASYVTVRR